MAITNPFKRTTDSDKETPTDTSEQIRKLQAEIDLASKWFEKNFWLHADERINFYELNHYYDPNIKSTPMVDYDRIKVPYPYANARQILAEIYVKLPEPLVKPKKADKSQIEQVAGAPIDPTQEFTPEMTMPGQFSPDGAMLQPPQKVDLRKGAQKLKAALEYCRDESRLKNEAKMFVLDGIVTGMGILMFSAQKDTKVPKYTRCLYRHIVYSSDVTNPYDSPWVARKIVRRLDEAKNDESYDPNVRKTLKASAQPDKALTEDMSETMKSEFSYTVIWDYYNKKTDKHCVWGEGCEKYLSEKTLSEELELDIESDEYPTDWPFTFFVNEEMLSKSLGLGDIAPILPSVKENDKIRTMEMNHIKRHHRKYGVGPNSLDEQGMQQFKQPIDGMVVKFKSDDWQQTFAPIQDAPISQDVYRVGEIVERDIQTISPIGPNSLVRGVGQQPDTLGQSQIIEENTQTRLDEKRDTVAESFRRIFRMTAQFIQQTWVEEDVLRVTGDGSKPTDWLVFTPDEVKGEYDYDVDPETMRDNTVLYRRQLAEAMQVGGQILAQINPQGLPILLRQYFETFPNLKTVLDQLVPEQLLGDQAQGSDPMAREMLIEEIKSKGPEAVLDRISQLPQNERQALTAEVNRIVASLSSGQTTQPSQPAMAGAANRI